MYSNTLHASTRVWGLEKYQRLNDIRCNPMIIEKRVANELAIQVNMNLKMLSIVNNGMKLEEFCFSPLVYSHEIICKDVRVLFNTKSQRDGSSNGKFRVRFRSLDYCQSFCSFLSSFLNIIMYEDLQRRDSQSQMNFSMSTSDALNNSYTINNSFSQTQTDTVPSTLSTPGGAMFDSMTPQPMMSGGLSTSQMSQSAGGMPSMMSSASGFSAFNSAANSSFNSAATPSTMPSCNPISRPATPTPTVGNAASNSAPYTAVPTATTSNTTNSTQVQAPVVNVQVSNLISDKAMGQFTTMMESFFERLFSLLESKCVTPQYGWYPIVPQTATNTQNSRKRAGTGAAGSSTEFTLPEYFKSFSANFATKNSQSTKSGGVSASTAKKSSQDAKRATKSKSSTTAKSLNLSRSEIEDTSMREDSFDLMAPTTKSRRVTSYGLRGAPPTIETSQGGEPGGDYLDDQIFWD